MRIETLIREGVIPGEEPPAEAYDLYEQLAPEVTSRPLRNGSAKSVVHRSFGCFGLELVVVPQPAGTSQGRPMGNSNPRHGSRGFPDGGAVRDDRVLLLELKAEKGRVSPEQTNWIARLNLRARRPTSSGCMAMGSVHRVDGPPSRADDSHNQLNGRDVRRVR
jgi:hypothetical protein